MRKIIAIDFDGCLVESQWPKIGAPRWDVIDAAREERKKGSALILWTCRSGHYLDEAVDFCRKIGLLFDAVNDNLPEVVDLYGGSNCRKIVADEYWDDHAVLVPKSKEQSWTDVKKALPLRWHWVLVCSDTGALDVAFVNSKGIWVDSVFTPAYWRYILDLPKGVSQK